MMKTKAQSHKMIVTVLVILISCFFVNTVNCNPQGNNTRKQQERAILVNSVDDERGFIFLKKKLHDQNDVIIYSVNQQGLADYGVSESMGQAMEYAALRKDRQYFDLLAAQTDKYYLDRAGYYYWKINAENYAGEQISALVDDLRIFKAYYLAAQNNMGDYSKQLAYVSESIYKFDSDGKYLYDFYDDRSQQKADYVSLFYLDMNSIDMLKAYDKQKWQELWQNSRELLQKIEKREYGFYPVAFSYSEKKYVWNETGINMVENLYTALNLYNADGDTGSLLKFMREEIKTNKKRLCHNKQLINSHFYRGVSELPYKLLFAVIYTHLEFRYEMSHTITSHHVHHFHQTRIPDGTLLDYMVQYRKPLFPQFFLYPKKFLPENNPHHKEFHLRPYIQNNANQ